jgi:AraC-like DNA-binding protein
MGVITLTDEELERIQRAASLLEESIKSPLPIAQLAAKVKLSEVKLKLGFKLVYHMSPYSYLLQARMKKAKLLLLEGEPIKIIVLTIGYTTESNFCKAFRSMFNETPKHWMKNQLERSA